MIRQKSFQEQRPTLYLVPTPIGNLQEMTPRALEILKSVDWIAAEDTRNTKRLLQAYQIEKPLLSHHEHNQAKSIPIILQKLEQGSVAVVSDAGYPLVSDPGQGLVQACIQQDIPVVSISGANAAMNALVASGLSCQHYFFYGFLDHKKTKRRQELETLKHFEHTMIFYEAPHRIEDTLLDMLEVLGNRQICLARELTKLHEEYIRASIQEVLEIAPGLKGEMVIVVEGASKKEVTWDWDQLIQEVNILVQEGLKTKAAIQQVAKQYCCSKNELYKIYHEGDHE